MDPRQGRKGLVCGAALKKKKGEAPNLLLPQPAVSADGEEGEACGRLELRGNPLICRPLAMVAVVNWRYEVGGNNIACI